MEIEDKKRLNSLMEKGETREAVDFLLKIELDKKTKKEAILISSRLFELEKSFNKGIISLKEVFIEKNKINLSLIDLIDGILVVQRKASRNKKINIDYFIKNETLNIIIYVGIAQKVVMAFKRGKIPVFMEVQTIKVRERVLTPMPENLLRIFEKGVDFSVADLDNKMDPGHIKIEFMGSKLFSAIKVILN